MPTSSIFTTVKITDPKKAEAFNNALYEAANASCEEKKRDVCHILTDHEKIKELMEKRKKREDKGLFAEQIPKELIEEG